MIKTINVRVTERTYRKLKERPQSFALQAIRRYLGPEPILVTIWQSEVSFTGLIGDDHNNEAR